MGSRNRLCIRSFRGRTDAFGVRIRGARWGALAGLGLFALSQACSGGRVVRRPRPRIEDAASGVALLRVRVRSLPRSLVPYELGSSSHWAMIVPWVYEPLVEVDATGRVRGRLAAEWNVLPGPKSDLRWIEIRIRRKARWTDGVAVSAQDVVTTLRAAAKGQGAWYGVQTGATVVPDKLEAADWKVVRVLLRRWDVEPFLRDLAWLPILPAHAWPECGSAARCLRVRYAPPGSGPYRVKNWTGTRLVLVARSRRWPGPRVVEYLPIPHLEQALSALEEKRVDVLADLRGADWERLRPWLARHPDARIRISPPHGASLLACLGSADPSMARLLLEAPDWRKLGARPWDEDPAPLVLGRDGPWLKPERVLLPRAVTGGRFLALVPSGAWPGLASAWRAAGKRLVGRYDVVRLPDAAYLAPILRTDLNWQAFAGLRRHRPGAITSGRPRQPSGAGRGPSAKGWAAALVVSLPCHTGPLLPERLLQAFPGIARLPPVVRAYRAYLGARSGQRLREARFWTALRKAGVLRPLYRPRSFVVTGPAVRRLEWRGCWLDLKKTVLGGEAP